MRCVLDEHLWHIVRAGIPQTFGILCAEGGPWYAQDLVERAPTCFECIMLCYFYENVAEELKDGLMNRFVSRIG